MSTIQITVENGQTRFRPGETIHGLVSWEFPSAPRSIELRLFWYTRGRGTENVEIVETLPLKNVAAREQRAFSLELPAKPYSFAGRLITLTWAVEVICSPGGEVSRVDLIVSPWDQDLVLDHVAPNKNEGLKTRHAGG